MRLSNGREEGNWAARHPCLKFNKDPNGCPFRKCKYGHIRVNYCKREGRDRACLDPLCKEWHWTPRPRFPRPYPRPHPRPHPTPHPNPVEPNHELDYCVFFNKTKTGCVRGNCKRVHIRIISCENEKGPYSCPNYDTCKSYHFRS